MNTLIALGLIVFGSAMIPTIKLIVNAIKENRYEQGKQYGYKQGYQYGYKDGHADGRNQGYKDGRQDGYEDGRRYEAVTAHNKEQLERMIAEHDYNISES